MDNRDRPIEDIVLQRAEVFVDPFKEADDELAEQRSTELEAQRLAAVEEDRRKQRAQPVKVYRQGVGKYLNPDAAATVGTEPQAIGASNSSSSSILDQPRLVVKKAKREADYKFKDFTGW